MTEADLTSYIRDIPDWPEPGVVFKDITPLLAHNDAFELALDLMDRPFAAEGVTKVVGIEARGFIFAAPIACRLDAGFIPMRKPGKLPHDIHHQEYELEYGTDRLEIDPTAIADGQRVVIVDDLIATGGTALAAAQLLRQAGAVVEQALFVIDLPELGGADRLREAGITVDALIDFEGH